MFINNSIVPVFAVTDNVLDLYRIIANSLVGTGAVSDRISNDSSNIIDLIQTSYEVYYHVLFLLIFYLNRTSYQMLDYHFNQLMV